MTYHKEEYTLHNGKKIYAEYNEYNICQVTKECIEMLLDLYQQGRADAIDEVKDTIRDIHDNVANEMYCKGIDDFLTEICKMIVQSENNGNYRFYAVEIKQAIADLAEQLKAGVKNDN